MCTYLKKMRVKNVSAVQKVRNNQINGHKQSQILKNQPRLFVLCQILETQSSISQYNLL